MSFKQLGSVQTYLEKFEELMNKVFLSEEYTISCYIGGLKAELQYTVRMFAPRSLQQAIGLAKLQEKSMESSLRRAKFQQKNYVSAPLLPTPKLLQGNEGMNMGRNYNIEPRNNLARPFKQLSTKELEEKMRRGLCYWCDEKYINGHKCKMKQLPIDCSC